MNDIDKKLMDLMDELSPVILEGNLDVIFATNVAVLVKAISTFIEYRQNEISGHDRYKEGLNMGMEKTCKDMFTHMELMIERNRLNCNVAAYEEALTCMMRWIEIYEKGKLEIK